jgi:hypothetical protein
MCPRPIDGASAQLCVRCLEHRRDYLTKHRGYKTTRLSRLKWIEQMDAMISESGR